MSVATFHSAPRTASLPRPTALAGLGRLRWALIGGLAANIALWTAIIGGVSRVLR